MPFEITCPHCQKMIRESDFKADQKAMRDLQIFFDHQQETYKSQLRTELEKQWKKEQAAAIKETEAKINNDKHLEIQKLKDEKNAEIHKLQTDLNEKIGQLNDQINEWKLKHQALSMQLDNNKKELHDKVALAIKETAARISNDKYLEIEKLKEEKNNEITALKEKNHEFETQINANNLTLKNTILEKENQWKDESEKIKAELTKKIDELKNEKHELEISNSKYRLIAPKTIGENFENEFRSKLKEVFFNDDIEKITTGDKKADFEQIINENEQTIGKIIFEIKAGTTWNEKWIDKFEKDIIAREAKYGILVANSFHDKYLDVPFEKIKGKNIFATNVTSFIFVTHIIRMLIIKEFNIINNSQNADVQEKLEKLRNWRDQKVKNIIEEGNKTIQNIINEAKKLEKIQTTIIKNANSADDLIIKKLNSELMQVLNTI